MQAGSISSELLDCENNRGICDVLHMLLVARESSDLGLPIAANLAVNGAIKYKFR